MKAAQHRLKPAGQAIISGASPPVGAKGLFLKHGPQPAIALDSGFADQSRRFSRAFQVIREAIEQQAFPGAALAVTYRGALIASEGFGRFTYEPEAPEVKAETAFDLASLTKAIATTPMAMLLYERAALSLDATLESILPEFVSLAPVHQRERRRAVTLHMLLAHSSGLPAYEKLFEFATNRHELLRAALTTPLAADPGTRADYSDVGFILLGEALERVADVALDEFAQREIFGPLGMTRTRFNPPEAERPEIPPTEIEQMLRQRVIQGEVNDENAFVMCGVSGHAGLFAPPGDIARFAACLLQGGSPILKPATVQRFTTREEFPRGTSRALGWDTPSFPSSSGTRFTPSSFGHLGFTGTSLWIDPKRQLSVTLLTNRTWPRRASQAIRQVRPGVHDAIVEALD